MNTVEKHAIDLVAYGIRSMAGYATNEDGEVTDEEHAAAVELAERIADAIEANPQAVLALAGHAARATRRCCRSTTHQSSGASSPWVTTTCTRTNVAVSGPTSTATRADSRTAVLVYVPSASGSRSDHHPHPRSYR